MGGGRGSFFLYWRQKYCHFGTNILFFPPLDVRNAAVLAASFITSSNIKLI